MKSHKQVIPQNERRKRTVACDYYGPDNPSFAQRFWSPIKLVIGLLLAVVLILVLMGLLKVMGVKGIY